MSQQDALKELGQGGAQPNISQTLLKGHSINLPPVAEQRRIVAKIDRLSARSKRARDELERASVRTIQLRQAILSDEFQDASSASDKQCSIVAYLERDIRNGLSITGSDMPPGVPALKLSALSGDTVDIRDVRYLQITAERAGKYALVPDDLLVSRGNGSLKLVGKASKLPVGCEQVIFPDTAFRLRPHKAKADSRWILWMWNSLPVRKQIEAVARTTAGIWKISQADVVAVRLPQIALADQQEIVRRIEHAFAAIDRLATEARSARALLDTLDQAILSKAFRGELVPQDPDEEPAGVLLERISAERAATPPKARGRRKA